MGEWNNGIWNDVRLIHVNDLRLFRLADEPELLPQEPGSRAYATPHIRMVTRTGHGLSIAASSSPLPNTLSYASSVLLLSNTLLSLSLSFALGAANWLPLLQLASARPPASTLSSPTPTAFPNSVCCIVSLCLEDGR